MCRTEGGVGGQGRAAVLVKGQSMLVCGPADRPAVPPSALLGSASGKCILTFSAGGSWGRPAPRQNSVCTVFSKLQN